MSTLFDIRPRVIALEPQSAATLLISASSSPCRTTADGQASPHQADQIGAANGDSPADRQLELERHGLSPSRRTGQLMTSSLVHHASGPTSMARRDSRPAIVRRRSASGVRLGALMALFDEVDHSQPTRPIRLPSRGPMRARRRALAAVTVAMSTGLRRRGPAQRLYHDERHADGRTSGAPSRGRRQAGSGRRSALAFMAPASAGSSFGHGQRSRPRSVSSGIEAAFAREDSRWVRPVPTPPPLARERSRPARACRQCDSAMRLEKRRKLTSALDPSRNRRTRFPREAPPPVSARIERADELRAGSPSA